MGSPAAIRAMESGGPGAKTLALFSRCEARWGCGWLPKESFPLQNAAARSSFGAVGALGPRHSTAELAQGAWLGPRRRSPSRTQSYFPTKRNPWGLGFARWRAPANQQGSGIQVQPSTALPYGERRAGAKRACAAFLSQGA